MKGYSPKLPLTIDARDGFRLNKNLQEVVKQNLKMLVLTSPGERIMEPSFGVGIYNFLFELNSQLTRDGLRERIIQQANRYLPFVKINSIFFGNTPEEDEDREMLGVVITYSIPALKKKDKLNIGRL
tara:strand:- start:328 stop:708 length:381 start_codon:yes stop_codon:yes gene_type:complete